MKLLISLGGLIALSLPSLAFASFSLMSIKSIQCRDAAPTATIGVVLTTDDSAAKAYPHTATTIGFDYWNQTSHLGDAQSGKFTLQNNPDADNGMISLIDLYAIGTPSASALILQPTEQLGVFTGSLEGQVETANGWRRVGSHPLNCQIKYN